MMEIMSLNLNLSAIITCLIRKLEIPKGTNPKEPREYFFLSYLGRLPLCVTPKL